MRPAAPSSVRSSVERRYSLQAVRRPPRYPARMDARERQERLVARALGERIPQLKDPRVPLVVSVERVRLNNDFSQAKVLVSTLQDDDLPDLQAALERASGFLQRGLAEDLDLRRTPRLTFTVDPLEVL